jgi:hypothetical protein
MAGKRTATDAFDDANGRGSNVDGELAVDEKQRMCEEMEREFLDAGPEEIVAKIDEQYERWGIVADDRSFGSIVSRAFENFGIPLHDFDPAEQPGPTVEDMDVRIWRHEALALLLLEKTKTFGADDRSDQFGRVGRILESIFYAKKLVFATIFAKNALEVAARGAEANAVSERMDDTFGSWGLRFRWIGETQKELTSLQNLLIHMLDAAQERGYRKHGENVMCRILSSDGKATHAWKVHSTITEFVDAFTAKETNWDPWKWKTSSPGMRENVIAHLTDADDYQFPRLVRNRSTFSFRNGLYVAGEDRFCDFDALGPSVVSAKYFDADIDAALAHGDWRAMPTPHLDSVLESQDFDPSVREWLYVLFGRLLYDVGERDGWQVIPMLLGLAGTGKSLLTTKVAKAFYEAADCGVLGNSIEKRFGLSSFYDKLMFIAPELRHDFQLDQAEFQSMISGEEILLSQKFKTAKTVKWRPPGILAGNEIPEWADAAGSITRRIVVFDFAKPITNPDMSLEKKLEAEIPTILVKSNKAYLEKVAAIGNQSVWNHLPPYFLRNQSKMAAETSAIEAFVIAGSLALGEGLFMPLDDFKKRLKAFEIENGYKPAKLTTDLFRTPFARHGLKIDRCCREYDGKKLTRDYVFGADVHRSEDTSAALLL